jgi:hypothetical protein
MLLEELVRKVAISGWTDSGGVRCEAKRCYDMNDLIDCLDRDAEVDRLYAEGTRRSIRQRLTAQAASELFTGVPTKLSELLQSGRVTILTLGRLPDPVKQALASILARQIVRNRRDASFAQKRLDLDPALTDGDRERLRGIVEHSLPRTWLIADEAQVLAGSDKRTLSGETLVKFAKEGRNYGLSLGIDTQQPSAVDSRLMSQVETLVVHQLASRADIDVALRSIKSPLPDEIRVDGTIVSPEDLLRVLSQGDALFSCANAGAAMSRACVVRIRPRVTAHGGYEA